jgi:cation transport ATPase
MAILKKLFQSGAKELVDSVGNAIDKIHTSAEEKELIKAEINKKIFDFESNLQQEVTKRWEADMKSDNWLSKSIRPLVLAWLVVSTTILIFIDAGVITFVVEDKWTDLLQLVLITVIGAYFGGRSYEKIKR